MAIILRLDKGSELTFAEVDGNFSSLFYSANLVGTNLNFYTYPNVLASTVDLSGIPGIGGIEVQDDGSTIVNSATGMNFIGSGVTVTPNGNIANVTFTGGGDIYTLVAGAKVGDSVPLNLDALAGADSTVNLTEGTNVTLTQTSATEITIDAAGANLVQELTSNQNVGGITDGEVFSAGSTIEALLRDMLITYQEPNLSSLTVRLSTSTISNADRDVGDSFTCDNSTFNATVDNPNGNYPENSILQITNADGGTINITGPTTLVASNTITYSSTETINRATTNGTVIFKVTTESQTTSDTQTISRNYPFKWRNYLLATSVDLITPVTLQTALDDAAVVIQEPFDTNRSWTATATAANNTGTNYTYIVYPSSYGDLSNIIQDGSLPVLTAFTKLTDQSANNNQGSSQTWRIYKSNAPGAFALGTTLAIT